MGFVSKRNMSYRYTYCISGGVLACESFLDMWGSIEMAFIIAMFLTQHVTCYLVEVVLYSVLPWGPMGTVLLSKYSNIKSIGFYWTASEMFELRLYCNNCTPSLSP